MGGKCKSDDLPGALGIRPGAASQVPSFAVTEERLLVPALAGSPALSHTSRCHELDQMRLPIRLPSGKAQFCFILVS